MNILVVNAGSSSLKYQLIDMNTEKPLAKGTAERIGIKNSVLTHKVPGREPVVIEKKMKDHKDAISLMIKALTDSKTGVIASMDEISAVGHRVVHGGESFARSVLIDETVIRAIEKNAELAPLHNPANLMGIRACQNVMPEAKMAAVFDTAFHQSMPEVAYLYAIPYEMYQEKKIRKYGFHGSSHRYVALKAAEMLNRPIEELKLINCHIGNGSSVCAIKYGKSVDTSMGMTPLEGLIMGTRCGDLDPAIIQHIMNSYKMTINEVMDVLNKKSGFLGLSQYSSDNRDIMKAAQAGNKQCQIAVDALEYQLRKYIGAYAAAMDGVDAIIFTAGIGENSPELRTNVIGGLSFLGAAIDEEKNLLREDNMDISAESSRVRVLRIATNEELMIARDTLELISK
ncbi:MAG: acetate kinase [Clostridia bacterium]|nr:acetate kinase [Clostridia bacterium]